MAAPLQLSRENTQLLVIDVQEKLAPHISDRDDVVRQIVRMIRAAGVLELPVTLTEQYPRGLGATIAPISDAAAAATRFAKDTFSCMREKPIREHLLSSKKSQVLIVGAETHVCVQQTAFDLLAADVQPFVLADAVSSRRPRDREVAFERQRAAGVTVTTVESAIYELMQRSGTDRFKQMLPIVR